MAESDEVIPLVLFARKARNFLASFLGQAAKNDFFRQAYAIFGLLVLLGTTVLWAWLGARLQAHNADQLSDPYMFSDWKTFQGASFPGAHTFLLKWPIFWLVGISGVTPNSLLVATICVAVLTVATLAVVLYKIDGRPLVFGTICLALSLALLLIPAQPYAGGLLPTNMAMLTTRNLEYAVYLVALVFLARSKRIRDWDFAFATALLAILIASDKLFLSLSAGGALLAVITYVLIGNWRMATFAVRWMISSLVAAVAAMSVLNLITVTHLTHLVDSAATTPYGMTHGVKGLALGVAYAVLGLFTNVGANPVYDNRVLSELPGQLTGRLWSPYAVVYIAALLVLLYALYLAWSVLRASLKRTAHANLPVANVLAWTLIWSTIAAFGVFVATDHYFAVDARYLAIAFFTLAVCASVALRKKQWRWPEDLLIVAPALLIFIVVAMFAAVHVHGEQSKALETVDTRNVLVADALKQHKVDVLVGDYWRVLPVRLASGDTQNVMPLTGCTQPGTVLTSKAWQPNLHKKSFAYLISLDNSGNLANFPHCSFQEVTDRYGVPNATQVIAGSPAKPVEALLFYDRGSRSVAHAEHAEARTPILPVSLGELKGTECAQSTVMNIVAHEDDDLLFLSPDLLHDLDSGACVRTVYLTAGDAGHGQFYWLSRQLGSEAAYSTMLGKKNWIQQTVKLAADEYITVATMRNDPRVSLIFFNLPDGNPHGEGFPDNHFESLAKLYDGRIDRVESVDGQSSYSSGQLISALAMLMKVYQPATIHTQAEVVSDVYPDHSDHITAGRYAQAAVDQYDQIHFGGAVSLPIVRYVGYPIHEYDANVEGLDLERKETAFLAYGQYDGGVCHTREQCGDGTVYRFYLPRQYPQF